MDEKELQGMKADLEKLKTHLDEREKGLEAAEKEKPLTKEQEKLIAEGCKAYGIDRKFLFSSGIDPHTGEAVILTHGGKKIRHKKGDKAKFELTETQITGNLTEQDLVWSEKYNQKINLLSLFKKRKKG